MGSFLIAGANVFGCGTGHFERSSEAGQRGEDTARPSLAGEAIANANASWLAFYLNA